jgi:outer membrane protein OmpA-like peptidoglycan-associated protein
LKAFFAIAAIVLALATPGQARDFNYVVIGAFGVRDNAVRLAEKSKSQFDINPVRNLYYVFVLKTEDHASAIAEALRLQTTTSYKDAWVFFGNLGEGGGGIDVAVDAPKEQLPVAIAEQPKVEQPKPEEPKIEAPVSNTARDPDAKVKGFYFSVMKEDGEKVDGAEIAVIEPKSMRKEFVHKGNENVTMKAINQTGVMRLECDLVGYRQIIQMINFKTPDSTGGVKIEDDRIFVPFFLVRLKKGDHAILYNVFFFRDAAIMRPESKVELDGLLAMMNENPKYKIKLHGHTNGNSPGPVLEAGDSGNLFSLTGAREGKGSAKKLSEKRANVIRDYLMQNGIDAGRMSVKAWGGKKPLYGKDHAQASANVRVEIEVVDE